MNAKLKTRTLRARRNTMARTIRIHGMAATIRRPHLYLKTMHSSGTQRIDDDGLLIAYRNEGCIILSTNADGG